MSRRLVPLNVTTFVMLVTLFLTTQGIVSLVRGADLIDFDTESGDSVIQIMWVLVYLASFLVAGRRFFDVLGMLRKSIPLTLFLTVVFFSFVWSEVPDVTFRKVSALMGATFVGLLLSLKYSPLQFLAMLATVYRACILISILFVFAMPSYGLMGGVHEGAWRGIFTHKNILGCNMILAYLVFWMNYKIHSTRKEYFWMGLSVILLLKTTSATAFGVLVFVILSAIFIQFAGRLQVKARVLFLILSFLLMLIMKVYWDSVFSAYLGAFEKDSSLTGRTDIWEAAFEAIKLHPFLGYGYSEFWAVHEARYGLVEAQIGFRPAHAHNGMLDLLLSVGVLGGILFVIVNLKIFAKSITSYYRSHEVMSLFVALFLIFWFAFNIAESYLIVQNGILWVIFVFLTTTHFVSEDESCT